MQVTAQTIAALLQGAVEGDPEVAIDRPCKIEEGVPGGISFLSNPKYEPYVYTTQASALLVSRDFQPAKPVSATLIRVDDVYASVARLLEHFGSARPQARTGISPQASVHPEAHLEEGVSVGPFAVIEAGARIGANSRVDAQAFIGREVRIGKDAHIGIGCRILHDCQLGDRVTLHPNVVIGADGFGFAPQSDRTYKKVSQIGNVLIGDDVEIGANTTVDRATMGSTRIGTGVKIDNLVMIAHNVQVGDHTVIAAQSGIAGSTRIGKYCLVGGQVGFVGHLNIADGNQFQAGTGVGQSIKEENQQWSGYPAIPWKDFVRSSVVFKKLPELYRRVNRMEKKLEQKDPKK